MKSAKGIERAKKRPGRVTCTCELCAELPVWGGSISFELACATVAPVTPSFDPSPLIPYVRALGVPYFYLRDHIVDYAGAVKPTSLCAYCARMKRGALYTCAAREGYNVLALAQHLDDLAESFVMGALHNGQLRTMRAKYVAERGVTVIRPLVYVREHVTRAFARDAGLPVINENCPACFEEPKERARVLRPCRLPRRLACACS